MARTQAVFLRTQPLGRKFASVAAQSSSSTRFAALSTPRTSPTAASGFPSFTSKSSACMHLRNLTTSCASAGGSPAPASTTEAADVLIDSSEALLRVLTGIWPPRPRGSVTMFSLLLSITSTRAGTRRSLRFDSPSRVTVLMKQGLPPLVRSRTRSAGKAASCFTSSVSPTRVSAHLTAVKAFLARSKRRTVWRFSAASSLRRCTSSWRSFKAVHIRTPTNGMSLLLQFLGDQAKGTIAAMNRKYTFATRRNCW
mmetsp:Transcript_104375/g.294978  ORF Transcript_104375/g.294978 Transcript_104375/m.294978 type:complete len:254 (+) Transcript_104375:672-1433(+)